jgi:hypothetical protein
MMDILTAIKQLEFEWDFVGLSGFFGQLKLGVFDEQGFQRVKAILDAVDLPQGDELDRRFVEVTWFIPTFMRWQRDAWVMDGKDTAALDMALSFVEQRLTTILGLP